MTYILQGDLARLRIPPFGPPRRADRLWRHTCFEAFLSMEGGSAYSEFNFAPSGEWAAYTFRCYREKSPLDAEGLAPGITVHRSADSLALDATIRSSLLSTIAPRTRLRLGLCAVIEENAGKLSYWALQHPPGKPDFHHSDAFALELASNKQGAPR